MRTVLVCYSLHGLRPIDKVKVCRKLYGYKDNSNHGKYTYRREGILDKIKHKKIFDAIIIVRKESVLAIVNVLKEFNVKYYVFGVIGRYHL